MDKLSCIKHRFGLYDVRNFNKVTDIMTTHVVIENVLCYMTSWSSWFMFVNFSIRDISCKQNVKVQVKLMHFLVGFGLGLDFSDSL